MLVQVSTFQRSAIRSRASLGPLLLELRTGAEHRAGYELEDVIPVCENFCFEAPASLIRSFNDQFRFGNFSDIPGTVDLENI